MALFNAKMANAVTASTSLISYGASNTNATTLTGSGESRKDLVIMPGSYNTCTGSMSNVVNINTCYVKKDGTTETDSQSGNNFTLPVDVSDYQLMIISPSGSASNISFNVALS